MYRILLSLALFPILVGLPALSRQAAQESVAATTIEIRNARTPSEGLLTGGQVTEENLTAAAEAGYRIVINLRTLGEEGAWDETDFVERLGMRFIHIPVAGAAGLTEDNVRALAKVLDESENYPILLHCGSGNRVGALLALKAFHLDGKDAQEALEIGRAAGLTRLEPVVREKVMQRAHE